MPEAEPKKPLNREEHRVQTVSEFDNQFGPFESAELAVVNKKYLDLVQVAGKLVLSQTPRVAAKTLASGLLGQILRA